MPLTSSAACAALWAHGDESLVSSAVKERKTSRAPSTQINPDVKMNYSSIHTQTEKNQPSEEHVRKQTALCENTNDYITLLIKRSSKLLLKHGV